VTVVVPKDGTVRDVVDAAMVCLKSDGDGEVLGGGWDTKADSDKATLVLNHLLSGRWLKQWDDDTPVKELPRSVHGPGHPVSSDSVVGHVMDVPDMPDMPDMPTALLPADMSVVNSTDSATADILPDAAPIADTGAGEGSAKSDVPATAPAVAVEKATNEAADTSASIAAAQEPPKSQGTGEAMVIAEPMDASSNSNSQSPTCSSVSPATASAIAAAVASAAVLPRLVTVTHFNSKPDGSYPVPFGHPFTMWVYPKETLASVLLRIMDRLNVPPAEFIKWRPASFSYYGPPCAFLDTTPAPAAGTRATSPASGATASGPAAGEFSLPHCGLTIPFDCCKETTCLIDVCVC
jgi:hypothetical protein